MFDRLGVAYGVKSQEGAVLIINGAGGVGSILAIIDDPETLDIVPFKQKSLSVHWEFMFTRSLYGTPDML